MKLRRPATAHWPPSSGVCCAPRRSCKLRCKRRSRMTEPRRLDLRDDLEESQVKEMWQRIDHAPARPRRPWLVACVAAAAALLLTFGVLRSFREPETRQLA